MKWVVLILFLGLGLRLYRIDLPLVTRAADRELLTADITKALYVDNLNIDHLRRFSDPLQKPYVLEFPLYNLTVAGVYKLAGGVNEIWAKLISVVASVITAIVFWALVRSYFAETVATASLFAFYLLSPLGWWMARSFQPDSMLVMLALISVYSLRLWQLSSKPRWWWISAGVLSLAGLTKLPIMMMVLPHGAIMYQKWGKRIWQEKIVWGYGLIVALPLAWWYGTHTSTNIMPMLFATSSDGAASFRLSTYLVLLNSRYWINNFYHLGTQVLTPLGAILGLIGIAGSKYQKEKSVFGVWIGAGMILFLALPSLTLTQYYYYYPVLPALSVMVGIGISRMVKTISRGVIIAAGTVALVLGGRDMWLQQYRFPEAQRLVFPAVRKINQLATSNDWIVTASAPILYYSNRQGWAIDLALAYNENQDGDTVDRVENYRQMGAKYFVAESQESVKRLPELWSYLQEHELVTSPQDGFVMYRI